MASVFLLCSAAPRVMETEMELQGYIAQPLAMDPLGDRPSALGGVKPARPRTLAPLNHPSSGQLGLHLVSGGHA
jgi:hypothetical protein